MVKSKFRTKRGFLPAILTRTRTTECIHYMIDIYIYIYISCITFGTLNYGNYGVFDKTGMLKTGEATQLADANCAEAARWGKVWCIPSSG